MAKFSRLLQTPDGVVCVNRASAPGLRFWSQVNKDGPEHPTLGKCWVWTGYRKGSGYGKFTDVKRKAGGSLAHRHSWLMHCGEIPGSLWVLHRCDNPACVNPGHLFLGTHDDNMADMARKWRSGRAALTEEQVREIRRRFKFGKGRGRYGSNGGELAREFGITTTAVRNVATGRAYKHVI
jgi:hypothetical protein